MNKIGYHFVMQHQKIVSFDNGIVLYLLDLWFQSNFNDSIFVVSLLSLINNNNKYLNTISIVKYKCKNKVR